ncbi:TOMM precursor leader peptide-binding protein [Rhodoferax sp.]|uniref:TOMM precursor leader peptide-binding protein n=1 Tax=Rhodoferax sp. TaxID=50421 RepID=UPI0026380A13|nr:TOMM precursor leader peptide-binding protein [Rhodoferax sp.]MDD2923576.1 TOMM precursor leader peptide-binding protein [Rhodoferax sp.]
MLNTPIFKAHLCVEVIPGEGVLLLTEDGAKALHGALFEALVPLLDGQRSSDQIVAALAAQADAARVYYALLRLEQLGYLCEAAPGIAAETAAFWHGLGMAPSTALQALRRQRVQLLTLGGLDDAPMRRALADQGIHLRTDAPADFTLVLTDDYLHPGIAPIHRAALHNGQPWMLVKPVGLETWMGPVFRPGHSACYSCLHQRLSRNQPVSQFVSRRLDRPDRPKVSRAATPATVEAACRLAALEVAKQLAGVPGGLLGQVWSQDSRSWATHTHPVLPDPCCPDCGTPQPRPPQALTLQSRRASFTQDSGHRTATPHDTLQKYQHLVSPITGVVTLLEPVQRSHELTHVYVAGHNYAMRMDRLDVLKHSLRNASSGKGLSAAQAKASALCEAIERYSGEDSAAVHRVCASRQELGADAIAPNTVMLYSPQQLAQREAWNARRSKFNRVPEPLDDDTRIDWSPVWSLTEQRHKYLPTQLLYYGAPASAGSRQVFAYSCSNGNASGNQLEEAVLQGFFELVERDAVALWWYNRLKKPGVDVASFDEPGLLALMAHYQTLGRETWALDLTSDLGIPVFVALSRLSDGPQERILFGLGCHLDARTALQRAFAEMNQMLALAERTEDGQLRMEDEETLSWLSTATLANQPYLAADNRVPPKQHRDHAQRHSGDLLEDIALCQRIVEHKGLELLVLDQTRADVGMPVVKVIVPGLRHFWARFAPGRLYDVPVKMGWLQRPLREEDLNPIAIFF